MTTPPPEDALDALGRIIRRTLKDGDSIHVPELGTFSVEHKPSEMKKDENDNIVMVPPQDSVSFTPDA